MYRVLSTPTSSRLILVPSPPAKRDPLVWFGKCFGAFFHSKKNKNILIFFFDFFFFVLPFGVMGVIIFHFQVMRFSV